MFYNHYFSTTVLMDDGAEFWPEGYLTDFGVTRLDRFTWKQTIEAVEKDACQQALELPARPVKAKINWEEFGAAAAQDLECAHTLITQLLELIRDEGTREMSEDADQIAKEFGYKEDRIQS